MIKAGDSFGFAFKTLLAHRTRGERRWTNFDCDATIQPLVPRKIHFAHPACTERGCDFIGTKKYPG